VNQVGLHCKATKREERQTKSLTVIIIIILYYYKIILYYIILYYIILYYIIIKSYTKYMADTQTARTIKTVKESAMPKHKHKHKCITAKHRKGEWHLQKKKPCNATNALATQNTTKSTQDEPA